MTEMEGPGICNIVAGSASLKACSIDSVPSTVSVSFTAAFTDSASLTASVSQTSLTLSAVLFDDPAPLTVSSADPLSLKASTLLPLIFHCAEKWNAVLLLDEADIFLEQRSCHDVHCNALVSVFL